MMSCKDLRVREGFPGFQPRNDVNAEPHQLWQLCRCGTGCKQSYFLLLSGAVRYEKYSDFGSTFNGKLATRITVVAWF